MRKRDKPDTNQEKIISHIKNRFYSFIFVSSQLSASLDWPIATHNDDSEASLCSLLIKKLISPSDNIWPVAWMFLPLSHSNCDVKLTSMIKHWQVDGFLFCPPFLFPQIIADQKILTLHMADFTSPLWEQSYSSPICIYSCVSTESLVIFQCLTR